MGNCQEKINNDTSKQNIKINKRLIKFTISILQKESHGLYDYESNEKIEKKYAKNNFGILYNDSSNFIFSKYPTNSPYSNYQYILNYNLFKNYYKIYKIQENLNSENSFFWKVWNENSSNNTNNYLKEGQLIKLGKTILIIKESNPPMKKFDISSKEYEFIDYKKEISIDIDEYYSEKEHESLSNIEVTCRFCFFNYNKDSDPLISICKCIGSIKYTHYNCLREWMLHKITEVSTENYQFYNYQNFFCELCKTYLPTYIKYKNKRLSLINFKKIEGKYLVLELYSKNDNLNYSPKGIYFINFDYNNQLILGRGNDVDVSLMDISISRIHAKLTLYRNEFLIENWGSKFGTLLGPYKEIIVTEKKEEEIQIGNMNLKLTCELENSSSLFNCCKNPQNIEKDESEIDLNLKTYDFIQFNNI